MNDLSQVPNHPPPTILVRGTAGPFTLNTPFWSYVLACNYLGMLERQFTTRGKPVAPINVAVVETRGSWEEDRWNTLRSLSLGASNA